MAKRKKAQPWDAVFDRIQPQRNPAWVYVHRPTDAELVALETAIGSRLPESYRAFMTRFGPGELYQEIRFSQITPLVKGLQTVAQRTLELRDMYQNDSFWQSENSDWLSTLIYFGNSYHGDEYAWDPADVISAEPHECRIYQLRRMQEHQPVDTGGSFAEFAEWVVASVAAWDDQESIARRGPGICFGPLFRRAKKTPLKRDVKLWFAFNNHTVRDLALSIRDHGQTDAFPILADALQEAGCTNADLLDSCRTGDPEIDGAWVLQVLLGKA